MLRAAIIEDEVNILEMMKYLLQANREFELVGSFLDPLKAIDEIPYLNPDVIFIDIEMPKVNGLEVASRLKTNGNQIVFTTAYDTYAIEAFRVQATDYLLKPVTEETITLITERLKRGKTQLSALIESPREDINIQCFGSFKMTDKFGDIVKWPTQKTEEMFAYFLTKKQEIVSKWELAEALWPDKNGEKAIHNVHNTVYRMKKTCKDYHLPINIETINQGYLMSMTNRVIDFEVFSQETHLSQLDNDQVELLCKLYLGDLFQNKDYPWAVYLKESLELRYMKLLEYYKINNPIEAELLIKKSLM